MLGKIFLGRYEVQRMLGEGGMGKVYLARQLDLQREVVVKVMHDHVAADPKFRDRFQRETLLMARFQHPYAVTLYDASINNPDGPCIIMEYVHGETLDVVLARNRRLSPARVSRILSQLCEVLQAAHAQGIIHRDLKPGNIMIVDADTPYEKVKVMDFGLAKLMDQQSLQQLVDSGNEFAIGTPAYMCPEQIRGEEMDHRGDLYSVGVIVYEMLSGRLPFEAASTMDILLAHATDTPLWMSNEDVWVPPSIERVVSQCLAKKAVNRPGSARELYQRYEEALQEMDAPAAEEQPAAAPAEEPAPPVEVPIDPSVVVYQLQAWMPESVAAYKLRGFVQDIGGEVLESEPGRIKVRIAVGDASSKSRGGLLSWFGVGKGGERFDMDLQMRHNNAIQQGQLNITVALRYLGRAPAADWRKKSHQIFCDLRGYLMGSTEVKEA